MGFVVENAETVRVDDLMQTMTIDPVMSQRRNSIGSVHADTVHNALSDKYSKLEADLKKRLKTQAMLETDTRQLTHHTKQFFNQLNQQKSTTSEIISKLHDSTPKFEDKYRDNVRRDSRCYSAEINAEKKDEFAEQKQKNRQQFIYYNLDKLRHERQEKQIRTNIIPKRQVIISNATTEEEEESKEIDVM